RREVVDERLIGNGSKLQRTPRGAQAHAIEAYGVGAAFEYAQHAFGTVVAHVCEQMIPLAGTRVDDGSAQQWARAMAVFVTGAQGWEIKARDQHRVWLRVHDAH